MKKILIVDDEKSIREAIAMILDYEDFKYDLVENGKDALNKFSIQNFSLVLLDIKMPGIDGLEVLEKMKEINPKVPIIMISGHGTIETAIEATRKGAYDFLVKPLDRDKLLISIRNAIDLFSLNSEISQIKKEIENKFEILGESEAIQNIRSMIDRVSQTDARILITGENGTGKELVARQMFLKSKRNNKPFVEVNCAAIPKELIESELFGHEKGSFTGATNQRIGKFEQSNGGTIFLDEIGDMSYSAQAKVLRVLEQGTFERVGGSEIIKVDVRVISATNKDLIKEIEEKNFREDLYHRLNVIPIKVPPLSERKSDINILVNAFIKDYCEKNKIPVKSFSPEAIKLLSEFEWKGNVRELKNFVERMVILNTSQIIKDTDILNSYSTKPTKTEIDIPPDMTLDQFQIYSESQFIKDNLDKNNWNITKTAEKLGIQRSHLYNKMKKYGLKDTDEDHK